MKIEDTDGTVLKWFRGAGRCDWPPCSRSCYRQACHVYSKGAGRVDAAFNLVGLCAFCHLKQHAGHMPTQAHLAELVAKRERCKPEDIKHAVDILRRLPKNTGPEEMTDLAVREFDKTCSPATRQMVLLAVLQQWEREAKRG